MPFANEKWFREIAKKVLSSDDCLSSKELSTINKKLLINTSWKLFYDAKKSSGELREWYNFLSFLLIFEYKNYSQICQDIWVLWELNKKENGFFVEFGALDGMRLSNTFLLEKQFKWNGIVCEPNPLYKESLQKNRTSKCDFRCVYSESGKSLKFECTSNPELSRIRGINSTDKHIRNISDLIEVQTISFTDLLIQHKAPSQIDYLSIDTEGSEYDILKSLDWSQYKFNLITVEHNNNQNRDKIHSLLESKGYVRKFAGFSKFDDWYILK